MPRVPPRRLLRRPGRTRRAPCRIALRVAWTLAPARRPPLTVAVTGSRTVPLSKRAVARASAVVCWVAPVTAWLRALARRRRRRRRLMVAGMASSRLTVVLTCRPIVSRRQIPTARATAAAAPAATRGSVRRSCLVATRPSLVAAASATGSSTRPSVDPTAAAGTGADSGIAASGGAPPPVAAALRRPWLAPQQAPGASRQPPRGCWWTSAGRQQGPPGQPAPGGRRHGLLAGARATADAGRGRPSRGGAPRPPTIRRRIWPERSGS
jgi:hypothetical protein